MDTLKIIETFPEEYPEIAGLSAAAAALDAAMIWQRIEAHIAWRWVARPVIWTVEGGGDWCPPLTPVLINQAYIWTGDNWTLFEPEFGPLGFILPDGMSKIEASVGNDESPPAAVREAFRRLAEYIAAPAGKAGASSEKYNIGVIDTHVERNPAHVARALQNCGAADLLRPYRRA